MPTPEEIQAEIDRQLDLMNQQKKKLEELQRRLVEESKPLEVFLTDVQFFGLGAKFEIKFNRIPPNNVIDRLRYIPTRQYIISREVNSFSMDQYDRVLYELKELDLELKIRPLTEKEIEKGDLPLEQRVVEYKTAPDFYVNLDEGKKQIRITKSIKKRTLGSYHEIATWTYYPSHEYWTFNVNELMKFAEITTNSQYNFLYAENVKQILEQQIEREKLLDQFADMKDAPEIDYEFKWLNGGEHNYQLKPDQKVACKFDDTFNHRTLLSFDMGKGKTAIAIAQAERHNERVLFVCKADLKTNIKREIKKFTGKEAYVFSGIEPDGLAVETMLVKKPQYSIINYDIIGREIKDKEDKDAPGLMKWVEIIKLAKYDRIIFDEAHYMKNDSTQRSRAGRAIGSDAAKVMLLTGTPIVNRPGEIWPLLNIIDPVTFYDYPSFLRQFTWDGKNPKNLPQLHKLLKRYMIRRLRDKSLDPNRIPQYHTLSSTARIRYKDVLAGLYVALRNPNYKANVNNILTELLRCKQICADDKVDFTVDFVETALDETVEMPWNKVLVFSQFKNTQAEIALRLNSQGITTKVINGDVTDDARYNIVDMFQDVIKEQPTLRVIVTNIVEGLTLTQAGTVIINDLWWTPKDHNQAEGRAFGRENDPHGGNSYYILAEDTIDEMIWDILEEKKRIAGSIVDDVYTKDADSESTIQKLMSKLREGI